MRNTSRLMSLSLAAIVLAAPAAFAAPPQSSASPAAQPHPATDLPSGMATGKRQHKPMTITKEVDSASTKSMSGASGSANRTAGAPLKGVDVKLGKESSH
ncbi:MAG TPA: hypothetical protein VN222_06275 [Novosphingobium sp.]|nr:hypothetical protein [Novosphingobium sp.]